MADALRDRCRQFLTRKPPKSLGYVGDSIAERILKLYVAGKPIDDEMRELLNLCVTESRTTAATLAPDAQAYLTESADLLEAIAGTR